MISKELSATLGFAVREAKTRRHEYVCVEHVLYAILNHEIGSSIIEKCGGNQSRAAEMLGISRVTIWNRMKRFGITVNRNTGEQKLA